MAFVELPEAVCKKLSADLRSGNTVGVRTAMQMYGLTKDARPYFTWRDPYKMTFWDGTHNVTVHRTATGIWCSSKTWGFLPGKKGSSISTHGASIWQLSDHTVVRTIGQMASDLVAVATLKAALQSPQVAADPPPPQKNDNGGITDIDDQIMAVGKVARIPEIDCTIHALHHVMKGIGPPHACPSRSPDIQVLYIRK